MINHRIELQDIAAHLYRVTITIDRPAALQTVSLPVWIPGSYLVREYARLLCDMQARQGPAERAVVQLDKASWQIACHGAGALTVTYLVYAHDTSVRGAFLNASRAFFNGACTLLRVHGREDEPQALTIGALPRGWDVATAMPPAPHGTRRYLAADYDELIDHPVELGAFWAGRFTAGGVEHQLVVSGALPSFDGARLLEDARRICETEIAFWHGSSPDARPPFTRYVFLLNTVDEGYGGLEHRASTALLASRRDLPRIGVAATNDGYVTLLGLISHEYFHAWSVKRLKPAEFGRLDPTRENYTQLLWFFEGFTSYYDDLFLVRAGLIDEARYLKLVARHLSGVLATPGRQVQSVAQASFDAWIKYYRPDENTPNVTVSYYAKGSLVALALDLTLRTQAIAGQRGRAAPTLDAVMRHLWRHGARDGQPGDVLITQSDIARALEAVAGRPLDDLLAAWVHGTDDLPLRELLDAVGVTWRDEAPTVAQRLGLRVAESALTGVQVKGVLRGGAAERAGVAAGDELIAVDGWRVRRLDDLNGIVAGALGESAFTLTLSRDQRLTTVRVAAGAAGAGAVVLSVDVPTPAKGARAQAVAQRAPTLRRAWLKG